MALAELARALAVAIVVAGAFVPIPSAGMEMPGMRLSRDVRAVIAASSSSVSTASQVVHGRDDVIGVKFDPPLRLGEATLELQYAGVVESVRISPGFEQRCTVITAHEIAHVRFGACVTMVWCDDLWLNESFASWEFLALRAALQAPFNAWLARRK